MRTMHRLAATAAAVALLGAGCSFGTRVDSGSSSGSNQPVRGTTVTLTNCKAGPEILQVASGTEVTFKNNDAVDHTLMFTSEADTVVVKAGGSVTYRPISPVSANWTLNYQCDQANAGAIFVP